jgi:hypothetical protein
MSQSIRQSQAIHTWPAGSIVDFPELSLIMLSHDDNYFDWGIEDSGAPANKRLVINDSRLSAAFRVEKFVSPPVNDRVGSLALKSVRFPRAHRCPKCNLISYIKRDTELAYPNGLSAGTYNQKMIALVCPQCGLNLPYHKAPKLIPMRFVIATEEGFLDDFPWDWYVHQTRPEQRNKENRLYWSAKGGSASLHDIEITSKDRSGQVICSRSLSDIFDQSIFTRSCPVHGHYLEYVRGRMPKPWKGWSDQDFTYEVISDIPRSTTQTGELTAAEKRKFPRTLQRGAGNLFFPVIYSGIRLPSETYEEKCPAQVSATIMEMMRSIPAVMPETETFTNQQWREFLIARLRASPTSNRIIQYGHTQAQAENFINSYFGETTTEDLLRDKTFNLRLQEFKAFTQTQLLESDQVWFKKNDIPGTRYNELIGIENLISKVVVLEKLSVLKVFRGFTRVKPLLREEVVFAEQRDNMQAETLLEFQRLQDARKDFNGIKELPAVEVKGEGIFIQFSNETIETWTKNYPSQRVEIINRNLNAANLAFEQNENPVTKRYLFLHTLSHIILKELADDCGYSLSSLAEVIYCNPESNVKEIINGILIYTTTNDAEGSLGGLIEKAYPEYFTKLILRGIEKAKWCSSDPLCISAESGQGFMGLNLAACYSCVIIPETSCEKMNKYLDRATLIGTLNEKTLGLFNSVSST